MEKDVLAVAVGYKFGFIPSNELDGVLVDYADTAVRFEGENWNLFKAKTYEDSRKIDALLDKHGDYPLNEHKIEPVIMSGELEVIIPGFDKEQDSFMFGGYCFVCNGKEIPVDFSGIAWSIEQDGDRLSIPFVTGKTGLLTDYFLDDCYEDAYEEAGYRINDITAEFLSKASFISEFTVSLDLKGQEYGTEDIAKFGSLKIKSLCFENETKEFDVDQEVLDDFNQRMDNLRRKPLSKQIQDASMRAETSSTVDTKGKEFTPDF